MSPRETYLTHKLDEEDEEIELNFSNVVFNFINFLKYCVSFL